jgi:tetratricopeptide (TPR) repeat protein
MLHTLQQGLNFLNAGRSEQAAECARRVLRAKHDSPDAHFLIGLIALQRRQQVPALQAFQSVAQLDPRNCTAWAHMAEIYMTVGQPANAGNALEKAIEHEDGSPNVQQLIAMVISLLGDHQGALSWFEKATRQQPRNINFLTNHANCLMYLGEIEEAEALLIEAIRIQPAYPTAHWLLSGLHKAADREHVNEMEKLIAQGRYSPHDLAFLNYGCGKELEDLEEWEDAFQAYAAGACARRKTVDFDEQAEIEMYEVLERTYTPEWLSEGPPGHDDASPIFVVGQPRSGTTLVERIITAHSQVHSAGELRNFLNEVRRLTNYREQSRFSAELVARAASVDFAALGNAYIQSVRKLRGTTPYFVDKLPSNFLFVPLILKALPNARIVHLRRNPMDACFSSFKQLFTDAYPHSYDQEEMARHHARYYRLMSVWRDRFGDRYHELAYEDVARDLEPNARALIEFLGITWEDACLDFASQRSAVTTASAVQVRQPVHTKSIGRWRRYEQQLQPMQNELQAHAVPVDV